MSFNSQFAFQCKKPPLDLQICFYRQNVCSQDIQDQAEAGQEGQAEPSQWIRMRTGNTIRYNAKRRLWRRTKLKL